MQKPGDDPRLHVRSLWRRVADLERLLHKSSCAAFTPMNETTVQRKLVEGANLLALRRRYPNGLPRPLLAMSSRALKADKRGENPSPDRVEASAA